MSDLDHHVLVGAENTNSLPRIMALVDHPTSQIYAS
jgi:hypothetical protein